MAETQIHSSKCSSRERVDELYRKLSIAQYNKKYYGIGKPKDMDYEYIQDLIGVIELPDCCLACEDRDKAIEILNFKLTKIKY